MWRMERWLGGDVMETGVLDCEPPEETASLEENGLLGSASRLLADGGSCRSLLAGEPGPFCCSGTVGRWWASADPARGGMVAGQEAGRQGKRLAAIQGLAPGSGRRPNAAGRVSVIFTWLVM